MGMEKDSLALYLTPIGVIHSPYRQRGDAPRQGRLSDNEITSEIAKGRPRHE
jgi:tRNA (Thr-GGU) A37 N-methylase